MKIHMYQTRHLFVDDDCVGKLCTRTKTVRLFQPYEHLEKAVLGWLRTAHGFFARLAVGEEAKAAVSVPPREFPDEIREKMTCELGDLTPAAVEFAREHWSAEEFERRYRGRVDGVGMHDAPPPPAEEEEGGNVLEMPPSPDPKLSDEEQARKMLKLAEIEGAEFRDGDGFRISHGEIIGISTESWSDAASDLLEAIEYESMTKKPAKPAEAIDLGAPLEEEAGEGPPVEKKRGRPKKEAPAPVPTAPAGPLKELEEANDADIGGED